MTVVLVSRNSPSHPVLHLVGATRWDTHSTTMHKKTTADRFYAAAGNDIEEHKTAVLSQMDCIHYFLSQRQML